MIGKPTTGKRNRIAHMLMALCLAAPLMTAAAQSSPTLRSGQCAQKLSQDYLCGPTNSEELVLLKGTPWIFASQYAAPFLTEGRVTVINRTTREWTELSVAGNTANFDRKRFPNCDAPLVAKEFVGHGMNFGPVRDGKALLYAINHGKRESIEVFEVSARGNDVPSMQWIGCIPSPDGDSLNTLAVLPDESIVATKFFELQNKNWFMEMMAKRTTGQVFEWRPETGWKPIPRSFLSGPNGVVLADDNQSVIVAEWGARRLHKLRRDGTGDILTVDVQSFPDNIHPAPDGRFLVVGQTGDLAPTAECLATESRVCGQTAYEILAIDPKTLATQTLYSEKNPDPKVFGFATSALDLGSEIWVGSLRGDKILILKK